MKKKRVLIVIDSLKAGGAEKSCVSFLNTLPKDRYKIDLMLFSCTGIFLKQVPKWVKLIQIPYPYDCLVHKPKEWKFYIKYPPTVWIKKIIRSWRAKHQSELATMQSLYQLWQTDFPILKKEYDVAISYLEVLCNYFVLEKVRANRKIIWIHNNYDNLGCNPAFDRKFFIKANVIATISPIAQKCLQKNFPNLANRVWFIENITNAEIVRKMAEEPTDDNIFSSFKGLKIISCGRLEKQKAYDRAIKAAVLLKQAGLLFRWIVVGDGSKKKELLRLKKDLGVDKEFNLIGIRENPYPYMKQADMLVVTSLYEGRSLVIDEAKILCKPIVSTQYPTVTDAVEHEKNGLICDVNPEDIAAAIIRLYKDDQLNKHICHNLSIEKLDNTSEIETYIKAIEG